MDFLQNVDGSRLVCPAPFRIVLFDPCGAVPKDLSGILDGPAFRQDLGAESVAESMRMRIIKAALAEDGLERTVHCL